MIGATIAMFAARKAYLGVREQIGATLVLDQRSKARERDNIYCAFAADLDALKKSLDGFHDALIDDSMTEEGLGISKSVILASRNVVWESCAPKIGLLDPNHAANIIETYRFIDALIGRVRELNLEDKNPRIDIAGHLDETVKQIDAVLKGLPFRPDRENTGPK